MTCRYCGTGAARRRPVLRRMRPRRARRIARRRQRPAAPWRHRVMLRVQRRVSAAPSLRPVRAAAPERRLARALPAVRLGRRRLRRVLRRVRLRAEGRRSPARATPAPSSRRRRADAVDEAPWPFAADGRRAAAGARTRARTSRAPQPSPNPRNPTSQPRKDPNMETENQNDELAPAGPLAHHPRSVPVGCRDLDEDAEDIEATRIVVGATAATASCCSSARARA